MDVTADSDGEMGSTETLNSTSNSSMSSCDRCSSFSRLSLDAAASATPATTAASLELPATQPMTAKPHRSSEPAWAAIRAQRGDLPLGLGPKDFKLVRRIGSGDIGTVYLCRLRDETAPCAYAMKVVDKQAVGKKGKLGRAETERRILRTLDHPFLPTLYAEFDASPTYSCVVMEYCIGRDLHSLRHRQPGQRFSIHAARFYAAEVLLALEYLHMLGIVYRDLKPENILIRSDGHIMLSDFDLSLESTSSPTLTTTTAITNSDSRKSTTVPQLSCIPERLFRSRKLAASAAAADCRFMAEPLEARSCSFVGTHEYVAPEVASGRAHGSAVDWWAYGVFLYELLYGTTPFAGPTNDVTLRNIIKLPLTFPPSSKSQTFAAARDLISALLTKDPNARLGSRRGAADVKAHAFFKSLNFALLRSYRPPFVPGLARSTTCRERDKPNLVDYF